ncbi:MAG: hypothetical protein E6H06_20405, partial [Bacteroidetes bacterium]
MKYFLRTLRIFENSTDPGNLPRIPRRSLLCFLSMMMWPSKSNSSKERTRAVHFSPFQFLLKFLFVSLIFLRSNISFSQIVINEVGIAPTGGTDGNGGEYIELFNKSACTQNIGCFVIVFSGTSGTGNPTGWTIKIPSGLSIPSGGYFIIGGIAGQAGVVNGTGYPTGGTPTPYTGTANLDIGNTTLTANAVYMFQFLNAGTLSDNAGQVTLLNNSNLAISSVQYNTGNNTFSYPLSAYTSCSVSGNTQGENNIGNPGNASQNLVATFNGSGGQHGIYLDATGNYQTTTNLTPGAANPSQTLAATACVASASSNSPVCAGSLLSLSSNGSGGTAPYTFDWTGPNGFTSSVQNPNIASATSADAGTYTVTVTDAVGCTSSASASVTVNTLPTCSITPNTNVCPGSTNTYTYSGGTSGLTYSWSVTNATISGSSTSSSVQVVAGNTCNGSFTVNLNITD